MNVVIESLNRTAAAWGAYVLHAGWQAAAVGLVLLAAVALGRRWPSPVRHGLLVLALLKFAVPPLFFLPTGLLGRLGPAWHSAEAERLPRTALTTAFPDRLPLPHDGTGPEVAAPPRLAGAELVAPLLPATEPLAQPAPPAEKVVPPSPAADTGPPAVLAAVPVPALDWRAYLMLAHAAGTGAVLAWIAVQLVRLRRVLRNAEVGEPARCFAALCDRMGLRRPPRFLLAPGDGSPFSCGVLRPAVVVPRGLAERLSPEELRTVLAHELAHHVRGDLWLNGVQVLLCAAWWFHPVVWLLNRALRVVREDCCDDFLLARKFATAGDYCAVLLREYLWRTLALRDDFSIGNEKRAFGRHGDGDRMRTSDPVLAAFAARYDRDRAGHILTPPGDETLFGGVEKAPAFYFAGWALIDPRAAVEAVARLPEDDGTGRKLRPRAWQELIPYLTLRGTERWEELQSRQLHVWLIDKEDL